MRLSTSRGIAVKPTAASLVRWRVRRCGCGWDQDSCRAIDSPHFESRGDLPRNRAAAISIDETQRVALFNGAAERRFGCPAAEALGQFIPARLRARTARTFSIRSRCRTSTMRRRPVTPRRRWGTVE